MRIVLFVLAALQTTIALVVLAAGALESAPKLAVVATALVGVSVCVAALSRPAE